MKNFLIMICCLVVTHISAQYALTSPIKNSTLIEESLIVSEESISYTKLTGENCSTEEGFGLADCGFTELNQFMTKMTYPQMAYELNIQDQCEITFTGTKDGKTENIIVSDCLDVFQNPIRDHLSKMIWKPVYKNGRAIDFSVTFNTVFKTEL